MISAAPQNAVMKGAPFNKVDKKVSKKKKKKVKHVHEKA